MSIKKEGQRGREPNFWGESMIGVNGKIDAGDEGEILAANCRVWEWRLELMSFE